MGLQEKGSNSKYWIKFKTLLVAKDYCQREGIDFNKAFSHVVKHSSINVLFAMVLLLDLELLSLVVSQSLVYAKGVAYPILFST